VGAWSRLATMRMTHMRACPEHAIVRPESPSLFHRIALETQILSAFSALLDVLFSDFSEGGKSVSIVLWR